MILFIDCVWFEPQKLYTDRKGNEVWFGNRHQIDGKPDVLVGTMTSDATFPYYLALEPPIVDPQSAELGFRKQFKKFFTCFEPPYYNAEPEKNVVRYLHPLPILWPDLKLEPTPRWSDRTDAVVAIMGNKFPHRHQDLVALAAELDGFGVELHLYGRPSFDLPYYRGEIQGGAEAKRRVLQNYRYCYCPENSKHPYYMTEKLPEAILAGCLPLYPEWPSGYFTVPWDLVSKSAWELMHRKEDDFHALRDWAGDNFSRLVRMLSRDRLYEILLRECQP